MMFPNKFAGESTSTRWEVLRWDRFTQMGFPIHVGRHCHAATFGYGMTEALLQ
ncbi:hypothetical protein N9A92_00165 [Pirellulales bacterium]|nr:hypothetical protein [Pirellulales bacterium]